MTRRLQDWAAEQAQRRPDATAVVMGGERVTYGALEAWSNRLAHVLRAHGCGRGDRVCLLLPKSPTAVAAILATLKAGGIYVPVDPAGPDARVAKIIASCEPGVLLAERRTMGLLEKVLRQAPSRRSIHVGVLDEAWAAGESIQPEFTSKEVESAPAAPLDPQNDRSDPAYILFTSGSTGVPKGVVITHSNVIHFIEWAVRYFGIDASDRNSGHSPFHFDLSVLDLFGSFAAGAELHLVPGDINVLPNRLAELIRGSELTQWFSVPSVLQLMAKFDVVRPHDFPALKRLLWCGEVFPTAGLRHWMERLPHVAFTNLYGPTEATVASSYYTVPAIPDDDREPVPIGRPCDGEDLRILDGELCPVPAGEVGDLHIAGVGLSPGYWRDPEKTREAFVRDPRSTDPSDRIYRTGDLARVGEDGLVYFVGREDSQIKSRGYRIELGEIETALNAIGELVECAVVGVPTNGFEGTAIACAYVPRENDVTPATLRRALSRKVPAYMLPSVWRAYERLPKNANGKIDRKRVKEELAGDEALAPRPG